VAASGGGTTAGRVAPDRNGLVPNRRAPKSGTAARATTLSGSDPKLPTFIGARMTRTVSTHPTAWCLRDAVWPEPGTARQRNQPCPTAYAERRTTEGLSKKGIIRTSVVGRPARGWRLPSRPADTCSTHRVPERGACPGPEDRRP
jgi:hypothetical protein